MFTVITIPQSQLAYVRAKHHDIPLSQVIAVFEDGTAKAQDKLNELMNHLPDTGKK